MARRRLGLLIVPLLVVSLARADEPAPCCAPHARPVPGVAWWARPSDTGRYVGYQVGGGCPWRGDGPGPDEGTWGWDYGGLLVHPHINLLWCRCGNRRDVPTYRSTGTTLKGNNPSSP
ncbi:MAG TPA: hypothetical protein VFW33_17700 [Gemmataceae bacterium]|nr:hypothetical protein [Gemmataceae bacterium]